MKQPVSLEELVSEVAGLMFGWRALVHRETGDVASVGDDMDCDCAEDEHFDGPEWLEVPYPDEESDWRVMRDFAGEQASGAVRDRLWGALDGRRPFRRFRGELRTLGLESAWWSYREAALRSLVEDWLLASDITYAGASTSTPSRS